MKENHSNKKKLLSEDELMKVTGGDDLGGGDIQPCHERKKEKDCTSFDFDKCKWDETSGKCVEK